MALEAVRLRVAFDWPAHAAFDRVTTAGRCRRL